MKNMYAPQLRAFAFIFILTLLVSNAFAQVGIGTTNPNSNAKLDITSTVAEPGGLLLPRLALTGTANTAPLAAHVAGMTVYNTATAGDVTPGYYYNDGSQWVRIAAASVPSNDWTILGNSGLNANNNFLGTTDNVALRFRTNNADRFEISTGNAASGGRLRAFENGDAAAPIYSWNANVRTGMFQQAANVIGFSTNGTERFRIPNANQVHANSNGTAALPFYSWASDPDIGIYRSAANTLAISTTATERMRFLANGQVVINNTAAPIAGDRLTVQGANDEYAINGYSSGGTGVGVYGENTSNSVNAFGVYGLSSGAGNGVRGTNNNTGIGVIGFSSLSGVGTQGQNSGSGYGMAAFNTGTGGGIYLQSNFNNIYSNLTATGGVGEYIDLDNQNGIGVNVVGVINPANPSVGTAGDVWAFTSALKTQTPTSTSVNGGILLGNQYGVGHGMLLSHRGTAGRNAEINSLTATNTDPNIVAIGLNRGSTMVVQNQNNNLPAAVSPLIVGDFGYFGTDLDDHIGISGYSDPSAGTADWGIGVQGAGGFVGVLGIDQTGGLGYGVYSLGDSGASGTKFFAIDDPRDPANKILRHASIESNEILNLYRGTETFSSNGKVVVTLPDYYDAINRNASYQLTPIGAAMPNLYIEKEIHNGTFIIAGGEPGKKVSWTVTSERNDPYLQQNPEKREMVVDKGAKRGKFLMPELYGQPKEKAYSYFNTDKLKVNDVSLTSKMDMSQNDVVEPNPANSTIKNKEVSPTTSSEENKQQQSQTEINTGAENKMTPANSLNTKDNN